MGILKLQSAPVRRGLVADPSSWSGSSTSTVTVEGPYIGDLNKTYTFTVDDGGTIGSTLVLTVTWDDGEGENGRLDIGVEADYTAGDLIMLHQGMTISFGAGTVNGAETFTLAVTAMNVIPEQFFSLEADTTLGNADLLLQSVSRQTTDDLMVTELGETRRRRRSINRNPEFLVEYHGRSERRALDYMEDERQLVTIGENYGRNTVFLLKGAGGMPLIGPRPTFTRSGGNAAHYDAKSGYLKQVTSSNVLRVSSGPELESRGQGNPQLRRRVPLEFTDTGKSIVLGTRAVTNHVPQFHPKRSNLYFTSAVGSPTLTWDTTVRGILDPTDPAYSSEMTEGVLRLDLDQGDEVRTPEFSATDTDIKSWGLWGMVRGVSIVYLYGGTGTANNLIGTGSFPIDRFGWGGAVDRQALSGYDTFQFRILGLVDKSVTWVSAMSLIDESSEPEWILTDGAAATRAAETLTGIPLPRLQFTIQFWIQWGGDDHSSAYEFFGTTSGGVLFLRYNSSSTDLLFDTGSTGGSTDGTRDRTIYQTGNIGIGEWYHIAVAVQVGGLGQIQKKLYFDGVRQTPTVPADETTTGWDLDWGPIEFFRAVPAVSANCRIAELRIDNDWLDDATILENYNRYITDFETQLNYEYSGRQFRIAGRRDAWLDPGNRDKVVSRLSLVEERREPDSLLVEE